MRLFRSSSLLILTSAVLCAPSSFGAQEPVGASARIVPARAEGLKPASLKPYRDLERKAYLSTGMWRFGFDLAMAAILEADSEADNRRAVEACRSMCKLLEIELPPFRDELGDPIADEDEIAAKARALNYLLSSGGPRISRAIDEKLGTAAQLAFDIGVKATIALAFYELDTVRSATASVIAKAGPDSLLPKALWEPLLKELGRTGTQASFRSVMIAARSEAEAVLAKGPASVKPKIDRAPGKVHVPLAGFSYDPPAGWKIEAIPGLVCPVARGPVRQEYQCNITTMYELSNVPLETYVERHVITVRSLLPDSKVLDHEKFRSVDGVPAICLVLKVNVFGTPLRQSQYIFDTGERKFILSCSAPAKGGEELDELFQASMKTFRLHPLEQGR